MATKRVSSASGRMYTYHNMIVRYLIFRSDHTTFTNVNELSVPNLETFYIFRLDAVQNIIKTEKNVNQLSGSPEKLNLLADYQHFYKQFMFLDLMPSKRP